jgi:hypothetical protein
MTNRINAGLSLVVLIGMLVSMMMLSADWTIALVPISIVAIVYLNLDPLIMLLNGPYESDNR